MSRDVDLRVHYSAPSARTDDNTYLAQATAYIDFVPARTIRLATIQAVEPSSHDISDPVIPHTSPAFVEETQAAILALDSQLIRATPHARVLRTKRGLQDTSDEAYEADSSGDVSKTNSSYLESPILDRSAKRRKAGHRRSSSAVVTLFTTPDRIDQRNKGIDAGLRGDSDRSTSQLPTSYSLSDDTSNRSKQAARSVQRSLSDPGPTRDNLRTAATIGVVADASTESESSRANETVHREQFKMIMPPSAQVGLDPFRSHVTDRLQYLYDSPKLKSILDNIQPCRTLDILERGHWVLSLQSWPRDLQLELWCFLNGFIQSRAAGCGIWCTWLSKNDDSLVKAYCWGEIAVHTYLLLYVASRSNIRRSRLRWLDATGQTIITVEPRRL